MKTRHRYSIPTLLLCVAAFLPALGVAQSLTGFTLIDASTNAAIRPLGDGDTVNLGADGAQLSIRADVSGSPGSVTFALSGATANTQTENAAPYALDGDSSGDYNAWTPNLGAHTLTATAYSGSNAAGALLDTRTIGFTVIDQADATPRTLTVVNGMGDGSYAPGAVIDVVADAAPAGQAFARWTADTAGLANAFAAATTFTMPASEATITATYQTPSTDGEVRAHGDLERWHKVILDLTGPASSETASPNPFMDFRFQARFQGPSGQVYDVPGFFAGDGEGGAAGDVWRAFFSPDEVGDWRYTISFRTGNQVAIDTTGAAGSPLAPYDGLTGVFTVSESTKSGPDFRAPERGMLINRGEHFLTFADGSPFYYAGAGIPENILGFRGFDNTSIGIGHEFAVHEQHWNPGDPDWTNENGDDGKELIGALNYMAAEGSNTIYFLPMNLGGDGKDTFPMISPSAKTRYDLSKLAQWEIALEHAQSLGVYFIVLFAETETANEYFWDGGAQNLGPERKLFYRMINATMGHHNALKWVISEETSYPFDLRNQYMAFLKEPSINPYDHPVSFHTGFGTNPNSYFEHVPNPDLDTTSTQAGYNNGTMFNYAKKIRDDSVAEPLVAHFDEPQKIENDNTDFANGYPHGRRNKMWPFFMGGGSGFSWYIQKDGGGHGFDQRIEDFTIMENAFNWSRIARDFFEALPVKDMQPDGNIADSNQGGATFAYYQPGEVYAVYNVDNGGPYTLDLSGESGTYNVIWYDPRSGQYHAGTVAQVAGGGVVDLGAAPFDLDRDWAALVELGDSVPVDEPPQADAGADVTVEDADGSGAEMVSLDGSASSDDQGVVSYTWRINGNVIATGETPVVTLGVGTYVIELEVADGAGQTGADTVVVTVEPAPDPGGADLDTDVDAAQFDGESHPDDANRVRDMGSKVGYIRNGTWVRYDAFDFGSGADAAVIEASSAGAGGMLELRLDSPDGPLIGSLEIPVTGGWNAFQPFRLEGLTGAEGVHDLYLVFVNSSTSGYLFDVRSFTFESADAPAPNQAPQPLGDAFDTVVGQPIILDVLANDSDPEGDSLAIAGFTDRSGSLNGTIEIVDNQFLYTPPGPDFSGIDVFDYSVTDGVNTVEDIVVFVYLNELLAPVFTANSGGPAVTGDQEVVFDADANFTAGRTYQTSAPISGTTEDLIFQSERWAKSFGYDIPVQNGEYTLVLKFAEIYFEEPGKRIFDVDVEGVTVIEALDIAAEAGPDAAMEFVMNFYVGDENLDLDFTGVVQNAKVSAIRLSPRAAFGNEAPFVLGDSFVVSGDQPAVLDVLGNDTDLDGPNGLMVFGLGDREGSTNGTVEIVNNQVLYTPPGPSFGFDVFSYSVSDGLNLVFDVVVFVYDDETAG